MTMKKEMTTNRCPRCGEELEISELLRCTCGYEIEEESKGGIDGMTGVYILVLIGGGLLAVEEMTRTASLFNSEPMANTIERGGASLAVLMLTAAFAVVLIRNGFRLLAIPLYGFSYILVGTTLAYWLRLSAKGFAPDAPNELLTDYIVMASFIVAALGISVACLRIAGRTGKRSHNQAAAHRR
jgi:hypothetical protein